MNNMVNFEYIIDKAELFSYFSPEIISLLAIFVNLFLFLFLRRKFNVKRFSDFIVSATFLTFLYRLLYRPCGVLAPFRLLVQVPNTTFR